jgi:hypothetical protein
LPAHRRQTRVTYQQESPDLQVSGVIFKLHCHVLLI